MSLKLSALLKSSFIFLNETLKGWWVVEGGLGLRGGDEIHKDGLKNDIMSLNNFLLTTCLLNDYYVPSKNYIWKMMQEGRDGCGWVLEGSEYVL